MEEAVDFYNKNGKRLFGIVHLPENTDLKKKKIGINLLNPGIKYRVAPNRLNVKLARKLCEQGCYVLRFDPEGIGDSEGELPTGTLVADIWEKIQTGLFVQDTIEANDFFRDKYGIDELIMIGNCGGAITALLSAPEDDMVCGLCLIDVPVNLRVANMSFADKVADGGQRVDWLFSEYMKRVLSIKSWKRFITMQTDYKALKKTLVMQLLKKIKPIQSDAGLSVDLENFCRQKKLNMLFFKSFALFMKKNKPVLFILAGNDPGTEIFQSYFQNSFLLTNLNEKKRNELVEIHKVNDANHIYTLTECQETLITKVSEWVDSRFLK